MAQQPQQHEFDRDTIHAFQTAVAGFNIARLDPNDIVDDRLRTEYERSGFVPEQTKSDQEWFNQAADILLDVPPHQQGAFVQQAAKTSGNKFMEVVVGNFADRFLQAIAHDSPAAHLVGHLSATMAEVTDGFTPEQKSAMPAVARFEQRISRFAPDGKLPSLPDDPKTDPEQQVGLLLDVWKNTPDDYYQAGYLTLVTFDETRNVIHEILSNPELSAQRTANLLAQATPPQERPVAPPPGTIFQALVEPPMDFMAGSVPVFVARPVIDNQPYYDSMLARYQANLVTEVAKLDEMPRNDWAKIEQQFTESGLYKDPKAACQQLYDLMVDAHQSENPYRAFNDLSSKIAEDPSILGDYQVKREGLWENFPFLPGQQWAEDRVKFGAWEKVLFAHDVIRTESNVRFQTETVEMHHNSINALMAQGPSVFDLLDRRIETSAEPPAYDLEKYRNAAPKPQKRRDFGM